MTQQGRFDGIDFWRGLVLCMILVDHMPGNVYENLTPRNFGFSDAAEAFVFLSGVSIALAYGRHFSLGERLKTLRGLARRALKLYSAHIALSLGALAIFSVGAALESKPELLAVHGRDLFVDNPGMGVLGLVSLGHQLGYFNILPLYMILILCVPGLLWLAAIDRRAMLGVSVVIYALSRGFNWNLPSWPAPGVWFFDPFAWQLLFAIGIAIGLKIRDFRVPVARPMMAVAAIVVVAGLVVVTNAFGFAPHWAESVRGALDLTKTQLGLVRLVHFLAVAYLIYGLSLTERLRGFAIYRPAALLGRHSLWIFALVSLVSAVWQVFAASSRGYAFDTLFLALSLAGLFVAARLTEHAPPRPRERAARLDARPGLSR
jgi:hypothetical protein